MTAIDELKKRYKTPYAAARALGLDAAIEEKPAFRWNWLPKMMGLDEQPTRRRRMATDEWSDAARAAALAARRAHQAGGGVNVHREASEAHYKAHQEHSALAKSHSSAEHRVAHANAAEKHELAGFEHKSAAENGGHEDSFHRGQANRLSNRATKASRAIPGGMPGPSHPSTRLRWLVGRPGRGR